MKTFILSFFVSIFVVFGLLYMDKLEIFPWDKMVAEPYKIPDLKGLTKEGAQIVCRAMNLSFEITGEVYSEEYPEGAVVSQIPQALTKSRFPTVELTISKGRTLVLVPELRKLYLEEAVERLESASLLLGATSYINSDEKKGKVVSSAPPSGTHVPIRSEITVTLSKGPGLVTVPRLTGKTLSDARRILSNAGLALGTIKKETDIEKRFGVVLRQYPAVRENVPKGTSVTIVINEEEQ
jgi:serine/threonine-protein kinase